MRLTVQWTLHSTWVLLGLRLFAHASARESPLTAAHQRSGRPPTYASDHGLQGGRSHLRATATDTRQQRHVYWETSDGSEPELRLNREAEMTQELSGREEVLPSAKDISPLEMQHQREYNQRGPAVNARGPVLDEVDAWEQLYAESEYDAIVFGAGGVGAHAEGDTMAAGGGHLRALQHRRGPHGKRSATLMHASLYRCHT